MTQQHSAVRRSHVLAAGGGVFDDDEVWRVASSAHPGRQAFLDAVQRHVNAWRKAWKHNLTADLKAEMRASGEEQWAALVALCPVGECFDLSEMEDTLVWQPVLTEAYNGDEDAAAVAWTLGERPRGYGLLSQRPDRVKPTIADIMLEMERQGRF